MATKAHVVLSGSKRGVEAGTIRVRDVDPDEKIVVTITLAGPKLPGPNEYVGQKMTPAELAEKFGAKKSDADTVAKALKAFGLKVDSTALENRSMCVSGTAKAMEAAFKPGMAIMQSAKHGEFRGRKGTLSIPAELKGIVTGVFGLDQRCMAHRKARAGVHAGSGGALVPLAPGDLEHRYNFPPGDGAGQTIAIAEFGGGYFADDVSTFCKKFGRPVPDVQAISVDAPAFTLEQISELPPNQRNDQLLASIEVMMDIEIVAGLCPAGTISVYFSTFDQRGWVDLLNAVITANPTVLSISWGSAEDDMGWSGNAVQAINERLNAIRLLGITTCVAAGDDGSGDDGNDGHGHVDFPGSSPHVLAVGGTMLKSAGASVSEVVWWESPGFRTQNQGGGATGGGVSTVFDRPSWQKVKVASINSKSIDGRVVPDVAALAGPPLYDLVFMTKRQPNGGTSASAPLWAALIARVNAKLPQAKQQRFLTPLLYKNGGKGQPVGKGALRDITSGNNASHPDPGKGYAAKAGFDAASGWGVPDGAKLLSALAGV